MCTEREKAKQRAKKTERELKKKKEKTGIIEKKDCSLFFFFFTNEAKRMDEIQLFMSPNGRRPEKKKSKEQSIVKNGSRPFSFSVVALSRTARV